MWQRFGKRKARAALVGLAWLLAQAGAPLSALADTPPVVDAGPDRFTPETPSGPTHEATLFGEVTDDGLPDPPGDLTIAWTVDSGPGTVTFDDSLAAQTTAQFSADGTYGLRLTADDGATQISDVVTVVVNEFSVTAVAQNLLPLDLATDVSVDPTLEVNCDPGSFFEAQFAIAEDPLFTTVVYDSGATPNDLCSHVAFAGLLGPRTYYWSARLRDALGQWSPWSTPTRFETLHPVRIVEISFRDGENGYAGARDADIRGDANDPLLAVYEWNQGGQDVLRTGRRLPGGNDEIFRSLLRFEALAGIDPDAILNAWIELTGYEHGTLTHFVQPNSLFELLVTWGEGSGRVRLVHTGEVSWTFRVKPTEWTTPGAAMAGADRSFTPLVRASVTSGVVGSKSFWSSQAFVEAVRGWVQDPGTNHGVLLQADDESFHGVLNLASREHVDPAFRPRLVIQSVVPPACSNGVDDDGDGDMDAADAGCRNPDDLSEEPDCSDGLDNDADGWVDYPEDSNCSSPTGARETAPKASPYYCGIGCELGLALPPLFWGLRRSRRALRRA